jgi:hypothetical protein
MCGRENKCKVLVGKPLHSSEDNIKMGLKEIGWEGVDWIHVTMVMNLWVP